MKARALLLPAASAGSAGWGGGMLGIEQHAAAISQVILTSLREALPLVVGQQAKHVDVILISYHGFIPLYI